MGIHSITVVAVCGIVCYTQLVAAAGILCPTQLTVHPANTTVCTIFFAGFIFRRFSIFADFAF